MTMNLPLIFPSTLAAGLLIASGALPANEVPASFSQPTPVVSTDGARTAPARTLLLDEERAELQAAAMEAQDLQAMRGGELSNHELTIGIIILAVIVLLILL